ncbi:hypothetical protein CC86DRAFT_381972 [Ophiobolus disseminans]|uniref:Uncharacterized protein n=1 Tax=Ophiobolus disseminans TaxID=1469910 RepID=A0A6A7A1D3_9PLEO|nr:hypothetical protein CC86DRAFT_381972 [Ophiobolus disseminans]
MAAYLDSSEAIHHAWAQQPRTPSIPSTPPRSRTFKRKSRQTHRAKRAKLYTEFNGSDEESPRPRRTSSLEPDPNGGWRPCHGMSWPSHMMASQRGGKGYSSSSPSIKSNPHGPPNVRRTAPDRGPRHNNDRRTMRRVRPNRAGNGNGRDGGGAEDDATEEDGVEPGESSGRGREEERTR